MTAATRVEHLAWCKTRALEYLDAGDLQGAVASMLSDLKKHPETHIDPIIASLGLHALASGSRDEMRRFIKGFQ